MKTIALCVALLGLTNSVNAAPYFRFMDPGHPAVSVGAFVDVAAPGDTSVGKSLALITHSTRDGCYLPSVVCEDWAPLTTGFSVNAGRFLWTVGPSANLTPAAKALVLRAVNVLTEPADWPNLKALLSPAPDAAWAIAFGPALGVHPVQNGALIPLGKWRGRAQVFAGTAWKF